MLTLADLLRSFSTGELVAIPLGWVAAFGMLAISYVRTKRWDQAWKERWERRHGTSLETLRLKTQRTMRVAIVLRWIMLAVFFMSLGDSFGPIVSVFKGLSRDPVLTIVLSATLNLFALLFLALVAAGVKLLRYQLRRINELLAAAVH